MRFEVSKKNIQQQNYQCKKLKKSKYHHRQGAFHANAMVTEKTCYREEIDLILYWNDFDSLKGVWDDHSLPEWRILYLSILCPEWLIWCMTTKDKMIYEMWNIFAIHNIFTFISFTLKFSPMKHPHVCKIEPQFKEKGKRFFFI